MHHIPRFRIRKLGSRWSLRDNRRHPGWCVFFDTHADAIRYIDYCSHVERRFPLAR